MIHINKQQLEQMRQAAQYFGSMGGKTTKKKLGKEHYKAIANKRWANHRAKLSQ